MLILIAAAAVGGCIAAVVSWSRAKTAAADAATAREVAERHAAEAEERLAASERESRAARERAEAEIRTLINQLYAVRSRAESGLNSAIASAKAEYKALPAEKQTTARKISICMGKSGELKSLESSCDKEVADIVGQMRTILTENGQPTTLADQAMSTYKAEKSAMYSSLMSQLYH